MTRLSAPAFGASAGGAAILRQYRRHTRDGNTHIVRIDQ